MEITVHLGSRSYPILIDSGIAQSLPSRLKARFPRSRFALVTNTTVAGLYEDLIGSWDRELQFVKHLMPDGERYKTVETWQSVLDTLLEAKLDRTSVVIALGGGVVGDVAGFAAAACLRGIAYVQVPTTLLAMVDSSVGGKTAVDHRCGKNLIGAFHQPALVAIDTKFLDTLSDREYLAGYAELFKYGFIGGGDMFRFVKDTRAAIVSRKPPALLEGIRRSIEIKAGVVEADERETSGARALLNFGHTFAHALEKFFDFGGLLHGEAVWWGMKCACDLGERIGSIPQQTVQSYREMVDAMPLPKLPSPPDPEGLIDAMFSDKKVFAGALRFVVPQEPGRSQVRSDIPRELVTQTLRDVLH